MEIQSSVCEDNTNLGGAQGGIIDNHPHCILCWHPCPHSGVGNFGHVSRNTITHINVAAASQLDEVVQEGVMGGIFVLEINRGARREWSRRRVHFLVGIIVSDGDTETARRGGSSFMLTRTRGLARKKHSQYF